MSDFEEKVRTKIREQEDEAASIGVKPVCFGIPVATADRTEAQKNGASGGKEEDSWLLTEAKNAATGEGYFNPKVRFALMIKEQIAIIVTDPQSAFQTRCDMQQVGESS